MPPWRFRSLNNQNYEVTSVRSGLRESDLVAAGLPDNPAFSVERRFRGTAAEFDIAQEFLGMLLIPLRKKVAPKASLSASDSR